MPTISWLGEEASRDRSIVGGKAANLSLLASRYRVPNGYCLTAETFREFATPESQRLPASLRARIVDAYEELATQISFPAVAVRSSAVDEDGDDTSFAGQHDTYLNISGGDGVIHAIERCWSSAYSERALTYRREQGLPLDRIGLAVLVQQLVPADVAAVVFSANPVSGSLNEVLINASWGLGESIVGGTVTPDTCTIDKPSRRIQSYLVGDKRKMTIPGPVGSQEVDVPRSLRLVPVLDETLIGEIAALAISLESTMGQPVDIECAVHERNLYLLQCRPITTLAQVEARETASD